MQIWLKGGARNTILTYHVATLRSATSGVTSLKILGVGTVRFRLVVVFVYVVRDPSRTASLYW